MMMKNRRRAIKVMIRNYTSSSRSLLMMLKNPTKASEKVHGGKKVICELIQRFIISNFLLILTHSDLTQRLSCWITMILTRKRNRSSLVDEENPNLHLTNKNKRLFFDFPFLPISASDSTQQQASNTKYFWSQLIKSVDLANKKQRKRRREKNLIVASHIIEIFV